MKYSLKHTTFRFRVGRTYSGEIVYGGCGYVVSNLITVLRRTKGYITYRDRWGKIIKAKREYHIKCELFSNEVESFYADSLEPEGTPPTF